MPNSHSSSHLRNYLVIITLVVGGVFVFLLMGGENGSGLTSAVIENARNTSLGGIIGSNGLTGASVVEQPFITNTNEVSFKLSSETIPSIEKEISSDKFSISSKDLTTVIKVNGDKLELNGIREINLNIDEFRGRIGFDDFAFSMEGKAKKLEVNGISLSSDQAIDIYFEGLEYQEAFFEKIELDSVQFVSGIGKLEVGSGLDYKLEEGQSITIYNYLGYLNLERSGINSSGSGSTFSGSAEGLDIIGETLDLNLR